MCPQQNLSRQVETWTLAENSEHTFEIPRVQDIDSLQIELDAVVNVTTAGAAVRSYAPAQLLNRLQFMADGKDVLDDVPAEIAAWCNYKRRYQVEMTPPSGFGIASYTVRMVIFLDRANINGWRPKDTSFQAWLAKLLQLRVTTGAVEDLFTGSPVGVFTSGTLRVVVNSHLDAESEMGEPKRVTKRTTQQESIASANSNRIFKLPVGNFLRAITIMATDDGEPSDVLVNNAKVQVDGVDVKYNLTWNQGRSKMAADAGVPIGDVKTGMLVIDQSPRGKFGDYIDLRGASLAELVIDNAAPVGTGQLDLVVEEDIAEIA